MFDAGRSCSPAGADPPHRARVTRAALALCQLRLVDDVGWLACSGRGPIPPVGARCAESRVSLIARIKAANGEGEPPGPGVGQGPPSVARAGWRPVAGVGRAVPGPECCRVVGLHVSWSFAVRVGADRIIEPDQRAPTSNVHVDEHPVQCLSYRYCDVVDRYVLRRGLGQLHHRALTGRTRRPLGITARNVDPPWSGAGELARPECSVTTAASPHAIVPAEGRVRSRWR